MPQFGVVVPRRHKSAVAHVTIRGHDQSGAKFLFACDKLAQSEKRGEWVSQVREMMEWHSNPEGTYHLVVQQLASSTRCF